MEIWDGFSSVREEDAVRAPAGLDWSEITWQLQETQRGVNAGSPQTIINTADIAALTIVVGDNTTDISNLTVVVGDNTTDITNLTIVVGTNTTDIGNLTIVVGNNTTAIGDNTTQIGINVTNIGDNTTQIGINTGNISTNTGNIGTNASNIGTNAGNIATNTTAIDGNAYNKTGWNDTVLTEVTLTFTDGTRTVAIAPVGADASYYINGTKYTFDTEQSVVIDNAEGLWYIYFSGATLTASQTRWRFDNTETQVMSLYWDATNGNSVGYGLQLHSWVIQDRLHEYLHDSFGSRYHDGLGVALADTATVNVATGELHDEDIEVMITDAVGSGWWDQVLSPLTSPIFYRSGAGVWRKIAASTSLCYLDTNVPQVNIFAGTWQWAAVTVNQYFAYWVVASSDIGEPVYLVPGQEDSTSLNNAIADNQLSGMSFDGLPTAEHKVIARMIIKRKVASPYYELIQVDDYRFNSGDTDGAGSAVSDHGMLTGLSDDDHAQYHNDARADTWIGFDVANVTEVLTSDGAGGYTWEVPADTLDDVCDRGSTTDQTITAGGFIGPLTGNADTVTTNANLTGEVTSVGNAASLDSTCISGQVDTTIAAADYLLFWDATDSTLKKVDAAELMTSADTLDAVCDRGSTTDQTITAGGFIGNLTGNSDTVTTNANLTGEVTSSGNTASLHPTGISGQVDTTIVAADYLLFWDATDSLLKKVDAAELINIAEVDTLDAVCDRGSTTDQTITAGGFETAGSIKNTVDGGKHYFGAADNYSIETDGDDAIHTVTDGAFNVVADAIGVPSITTGTRDALTPVDGMVIYNTTDTQFQQYENGLWVHKANVISTAMDLYITTAGNDTHDGSVGSPWASIDKALSYLSDYILLATITINIEKGSYPAATTVTFEHPQGGKIRVMGDYLFDTATLSSSSGSAGNWSIVFATVNTSYYTVGDLVVIYGSSGGVNPNNVIGALKVLSINPGVSVTVDSPSTIATMSSGAVTASIVIPQVRWLRPVTFKTSLERYWGIQIHYNCLSTGFRLLQSAPIVPLTVNLRYGATYNTNASQFGTNRSFTGSFLSLSHFGIRGMSTGWFVGTSLIISLAGVIDCNTGMRAYDNSSLGLIGAHIISCTMGLRADLSSIVATQGDPAILVANTTPSSPVNNNQGNQNSYMAY